MNKIKAKQNFSNIIHVIEFAVEVLALQELTQLVENQQRITRMWLLK